MANSSLVLRFGGSKSVLKVLLMLSLTILAFSSTIGSVTETRPIIISPICPADCICSVKSPSVCASCRDSGKNLTSNCSICNAPKTLVFGLCVAVGCPDRCKCERSLSWLCSGCIDKNADVTTNCTSCSYGFSRNIYSDICYPDQTPCPSNCSCEGKYPWICTSCNQLFLSLASNCTACYDGYFFSPSGFCLLTVSYCPDKCFCEGSIPSNCTRCRDPNKKLRTLCEKCVDGFAENSRGICSSGCPTGCNCQKGYCINCISPYKNPGTQCTTCLSGYTMYNNICYENCNYDSCICNPGCVACVNYLFNPMTNCRCEYGYRLSPYNQCIFGNGA